MGWPPRDSLIMQRPSRIPLSCCSVDRWEKAGGQHVYGGVSARLTACVVVEGRGWNKKRQIVSEPPVVRKVGIRPFNVGQAHLVLGSVACASTCHSSLNGRFPTFRFLRVGRCASGVYFFQGGSKTHSEALGRVLIRSCWESGVQAR